MPVAKTGRRNNRVISICTGFFGIRKVRQLRDLRIFIDAYPPNLKLLRIDSGPLATKEVANMILVARPRMIMLHPDMQRSQDMGALAGWSVALYRRREHRQHTEREQ